MVLTDAFACGAGIFTVMPFGNSTHVHFALVEILGERPHETFMVVNLFRRFVAMSGTAAVMSVTFQQNGSQPVM